MELQPSNIIQIMMLSGLVVTQNYFLGFYAYFRHTLTQQGNRIQLQSAPQYANMFTGDQG